MDHNNTIAEILDNAASNSKAVQQMSTQYDFDLIDAYIIQKLSLEKRYQRGERLIGLKMGFTSVAKMEQMGVHDMIWGRLTDDMAIANEGRVDRRKFIHPRAEPELCFRVCKDIDRELGHEDIPQYVDGISAAIEIIDSRYENFKFSLNDVVADNCSSSGYVIGSWFPIDISINNLEIQLMINGESIQSGNSSAILGDPWKSFLAATRLASGDRQLIKAGSIILAGAATAAAYIEKGQYVSAKVEGLGKVGFYIE